MEELTNIPRHVAIILDGNGRWAKKRGLPRTMGHKEGSRVVEETVFNAGRLGIEYLTVYAFSTENWKRSEEEVSSLMTLFRYYMKRLRVIAEENNVVVRMIGDRTRFEPDIIESMDGLERDTKNNTGLTFTIAVNYGGRDEIRRAVRAVAERVKSGELAPEEITEETIGKELDTADFPDPDLLIRTGGELRVSNFLLWQIAYSELYVTDVLWPDFTMEDLKKAVLAYGKRSRRFGNAK
ncbi:MAG: isoprenyl transferase [Lachnospiraceae bacterium]|nr:isoprenyl transferase [Lachnospiraceae bacterium]